MAEGMLFECPSCGSPLSPQGALAQIKCPYCGNNVIVPPELRAAEPVAQEGANPISIVMNESGTSIQVADLSALQPRPINMVLGESSLARVPSILVPPAANHWSNTGIWAFVIFIIVVAVLPVACSLCGVFGSVAGSLVPFFTK
jgi:DNA-directed RNA polymerase subunit RPC12/RpoP